MNTPNLTAATIDRIGDTHLPTTYNWSVRRLAGFREQLAQHRKMYETANAINDEEDYNITFSSSLIPGRSFTINSRHIEGSDALAEVIHGMTQRETLLVNRILDQILRMQDPNGDHLTEINAEDAPARLETLRLILTPEEYAAITAPAPMCEPEARSIPLLPTAAASATELAA